HWCHVMAHESFENPDIADLMNEHFVNIKVDREERPDVDAIYQSALAMLGEHGGWPLTMFLTPDGEPFWGGTYFPPTQRFGRPGFPDVLKGVAEAFQSAPEKVAKNVAALRDGLTKLSISNSGEVIDFQTLDQIAQKLAQNVDQFHGGIGGAPKFPQPQIFEQLWRAWLRTGQEPFKKAVIISLDNMCQGGIYDHLGGGFARYSVDERWLAPHFEKMLYDNAQLIGLLTLVWQETRNPLYKQRVEECVNWLEREMRVDGGGFASSLDADSEGEEGKFYVWQEAEIDALLGEDAADFKRVYDVSELGNWENKNILNRLSQMDLLDEKTEERLANQREVLLTGRAERIRPGWDDKVLADWNGLMIDGLVFAGEVFARDDWIARAAEAFAFIQSDLSDGDRLWHGWREGRAQHPATLDDYANMCRAAVALYEALGDTAYLDQAVRWLAVLDKHYGDDETGGYFFTADDTPNLITRTKHANDNAVPAGNGVLVGVFARLFYLTGDDTYRDKAERLIKCFSGEVSRNFFPISTLINGNEILLSAEQIVVIGADDDPEFQNFCQIIREASAPNRVIAKISPDQKIPAGHPAAGKTQIDGKATTYICRAMICSAPITDENLLREELGSTRD
ncbi:MAG TPA: thioredoxin domain-containing protein, partial [Rhodospirillaceae bacterium]|nr:thioredoxin domain-containing protein [Rhodospirillaceae bacterium]